MFNVNCQCGSSVSRIIWFRPASSQRKHLSPACVCETCYQKISAVKKANNSNNNTSEWQLDSVSDSVQSDLVLS
jgi:hypothetical protein